MRGAPRRTRASARRGFAARCRGPRSRSPSGSGCWSRIRDTGPSAQPMMSAMFLLILSLLALAQAAQAPPPPTPLPATRLQTRWAADVSPDRVWPEYPRPQLERTQWTNLNGTWGYAITVSDAEPPSSFTGRILVPFPIESQLSGAGVWVAPQQRLWYRPTFTAPKRGAGRPPLLNFG